MFKRFLNIALIFVLLISVIGVSTTKVYCTALKTTIEKKCCQNQDRDNNCCKDIKENIKLRTDLSTENASVKVPDIALFTTTFLTTLYNLIVDLNAQQNYSLYNPPSITSDIPILIKVFRI